MKIMNEGSLFSKDAWMAFIAHAAMAAVVIGPVAYAMAQDVARDEADRAVSEAAQNIQPQLIDIRTRQAKFETDIANIKDRLNKIDNDTGRILDKLDEMRTERHVHSSRP